MTTESDMMPWDVFEAPNGNRYVVLPDGAQLYLGHQELFRIPKEAIIPARPMSPCRKVGQVVWTPTEENIEPDPFPS